MGRVEFEVEPDLSSLLLADDGVGCVAVRWRDTTRKRRIGGAAALGGGVCRRQAMVLRRSTRTRGEDHAGGDWAGARAELS